mmetsp:Transcript_21195/g.67096  ORF Transcript_21195/g.67096 Transcript_21195/m.67096 type:complete len:231 (+) Transcript_21195:393-1085(+)
MLPWAYISTATSASPTFAFPFSSLTTPPALAPSLRATRTAATGPPRKAKRVTLATVPWGAKSAEMAASDASAGSLVTRKRGLMFHSSGTLPPSNISHSFGVSGSLALGGAAAAAAPGPLENPDVFCFFSAGPPSFFAAGLPLSSSALASSITSSLPPASAVAGASPAGASATAAAAPDSAAAAAAPSAAAMSSSAAATLRLRSVVIDRALASGTGFSASAGASAMTSSAN